MTDFKGTRIIAIDHGYGNIKTANTVTPTGVIACDSKPVFDGNTLEYEGKWYRIGEGHKEFIPDKAIDEDYYILTLMAIARELNQEHITEADVHIACGLPLKWVGTQRESFREYLLRKKTVRYRFNGKEYRIRIIGCTVFPQGYPAIVRNVDQYHGIHMVADIGNGTMNIMYVIDKKPQESRCWTEKLGVNQCVIKAKNEVMNRYCMSIDESSIERVLRFGTAEIGEKYISVIRKAAEEYVASIFETLRRYEYDHDLVRLHIVGGGACLVKNFGKYDPDRVEINEDICATAKGYEYLAYQMLRRGK